MCWPSGQQKKEPEPVVTIFTFKSAPRHAFSSAKVGALLFILMSKANKTGVHH